MATLPGAWNFEAKQGGAWSETITWKINNVPVNLSGYSVTLRIKFANSTTTVSTPSDIVVDDEGHITWTVPQASVDAWPVGFASYDIKAVLGSGEPNWLLAGTLEVIA